MLGLIEKESLHQHQVVPLLLFASWNVFSVHYRNELYLAPSFFKSTLISFFFSHSIMLPPTYFPLGMLIYRLLAEENSSSSLDGVWMNREQSVPTPVMMHSPHLTSTVLRDPKRMRPEDGYAATFSMPAEQHLHQALPPQPLPHHQHQAAIDYKYKTSLK